VKLTICLTLLASLLISSCGTKAPLMERTPTIWVTDYREAKICSTKTNCIDTTNQKFNKFQCFEVQDVKLLYNYVLELINSCQKWKN